MDGKFQHQHLDGHLHICTAFASHSSLGSAKEAKYWTLLCLYARIFVSLPSNNNTKKSFKTKLTKPSVCIISILRLPALLLAAKSTDPTWDNVSIADWSCIELNIAIMCPSLTTLKPLLARFFPHLLLSSNQQSSQGTADALKNSKLTGKKHEVLDEPLSKPGTVAAGENSDADTLNASEAFDLVQLESGLICLSPKASKIGDGASRAVRPHKSN